MKIAQIGYSSSVAHYMYKGWSPHTTLPIRKAIKTKIHYPLDHRILFTSILTWSVR